jgi:hypothetical protein
VTINKSTETGSRFEAWFKAQFGRMPNASRLTKLRNRRDELRAALSEVEIEWKMEDSLHAAWRCALYGCNARNKR